MKNSSIVVAVGDSLTLLLVTRVGFAAHGENTLTFFPRFLATYLPLLASWVLVASLAGLFRPEVASRARSLWRPFLAMLAAGPLAVVLRALLLNVEVIPVFAVVLGITSASGVALWRLAWLFMFTRLNS